jgi:hypothetical protein
MMTDDDRSRPLAIRVFAAFFRFGGAITCACAVALAFPGTWLDAIWGLNERAREAFASIGSVAVPLMAAVSLSCFAAAFGLWTGRRWGYGLAIALLLINLAGDVTNVLLETEPRAAVGIPIVAILLWWIARPQVRAWFKLRRSHPRGHPE